MANDLLKCGFVIVDLLDDTEVQQLTSLTQKYLTQPGQDFISSSHFLSMDDSKQINHELHSIIQPKTDILFPALELLGGTLATKIKGKDILKAHNDWSIVDETIHNSYNLWIPLVNTGKENGTLGLIPGSHLWNNKLRGLGIPGDYETYTHQFLGIGYEPALNAGQAILYNHKLIHYSRPNKTDQPRNTAIIGMKDKEAGLQVSFSADNKTIETYRATEEDFYGFDVKKISSHNQQLTTVPLYTERIGWEEIRTKFNSHLPEEFSNLFCKRESLISKLLHKFKFSD